MNIRRKCLILPDTSGMLSFTKVLAKLIQQKERLWVLHQEHVVLLSNRHLSARLWLCPVLPGPRQLPQPGGQAPRALLYGQA